MDNAVRNDIDGDVSAPEQAAVAGTPSDQREGQDPAVGRQGPPPPSLELVPDPVLDSVLDHDGPWSEDDYRTLSVKSVAEGDGRAELIDGALVVGPGPTSATDTAVANVRAALGSALPEGLCLLGARPVRMSVDCVLVPDLVVARAAAEPATADALIEADDVLMVVEIIGPEHGALDRSFKPQVYARSRVPYLLLVDHYSPCATASMLIGGRYHEYARAAAPAQLELEEPFPLRLPFEITPAGT